MFGKTTYLVADQETWGKPSDPSANDPILSSRLAAVGSTLPVGGTYLDMVRCGAAGMMGPRDLLARFLSSGLLWCARGFYVFVLVWGRTWVFICGESWGDDLRLWLISGEGKLVLVNLMMCFSKFVARRACSMVVYSRSNSGLQAQLLNSLP